MIRPDLWPALEQRGPRIHAVSNLVTANDCANLLLAVGAKPIMAQAPQEAAEITAGCDVTLLNLGTPDEDKFRTCTLAGREAKNGELLHDATSCSMCRRLIINAGIDRVVIRNTEKDYSVVHVEDWIREDDSLPQRV